MPRRIAQNADTAEIRSIVNGSGTKADKARRLAAIGIRTAEIARLLNMSSGHVNQSVRGRGNRGTTRTRATDLIKFSEYTVATVGGNEALKRFVNPDVMSHIEFRRRHLAGDS